MPNTLDERFVKDNIAAIVSNKWVVWNTLRDRWVEDKKELRQYLFATSTRETTNKQLPWKNSTVTPKLTQIRDNLHANYMAALFPRDQWFTWNGDDDESVDKSKKEKIEAYMRCKLKAMDFQTVVSQLVLDYIDYGNVFAGHEQVKETKKDPATGEEIVTYTGPSAFRISPLDICFDVTASSFDRAPCIVRRLKSIGELEKDIVEKPGLLYEKATLEKVKGIRVAGADTIDAIKSDGLVVDGFGDIQQYFASGMVELLDFYGDIYDVATGQFYNDMLITVVDRRWILRMMPNPSWTGERPIKHCGWRLRPDNLMAQGPLDQLVGMQYRIDHLENLKADVFDQIAHPITKIKGTTVQAFEFGPGVQIQMGDEGDVEFDRPDAAALSADNEIDILMNRMEEMAGAPKQAMGIRTPGEKTKYEVQVLENGAGRIFQSKVRWFEQNLIEPLLNSMFEEAVRTMSAKDQIEVTDPDYGTKQFVDITKEDVTAKGKFYAVGARHFAEQAMFVQELNQTLNLIEQIPEIKVHVSGKAVAHALSDVMGWKTFGIVKDNVAIMEAAETERVKGAAHEQLQTEQGMPSELQPSDHAPAPVEEPA
jgi:hypothetical protein